MTHSYGDRVGIRYMTKGLKVYYLPITVFYNQCVFPTITASLPLIRYIFIRERISIIHGHSAFSALGHEAMIIGRLMGLKTVFTDHSLFGFADMSAILTNKFLEIFLTDCNHCICVSHTGKENTVLRARVHHSRVSVIPNAVDSTLFTPDPTKRSKEKIVVVIVSRLVYRKGVDLMAQIISDICPRYPEIEFLIAGDGPKRWLIEEIRERGGFQDRITLLGTVEHSQVRNVLIRGHIFLNTSLTEAFCMAIVEAASCGLQVVSTRVGGIPEVLPPDLIYLTEPNVPSLLLGLETAISNFKSGNIVSPLECHARVSPLYSWTNVTQRTEIVYNKIVNEPKKPLKLHIKSYKKHGFFIYFLVYLCYLILRILDWLVPEKSIDLVYDFVQRNALDNEQNNTKNTKSRNKKKKKCS